MSSRTIIATLLLLLCQPVLLAQSKQDDAMASMTKQADSTVFGIRIGEKLLLPECKRTKYPDPDIRQYYDVTTPTRCFQRGDAGSAKPGAPLGTTTVSIEFPSNDAPDILFALYVNGQVIDGNLESVIIRTCGIECQDHVLDLLRKKYGNPSSLEHESKENRLGAVFASHLAEWSQFTNLTVIFQGTTGRFDEGVVYIMTSKGLEFRKKEQGTPSGIKF